MNHHIRGPNSSNPCTLAETLAMKLHNLVCKFHPLLSPIIKLLRASYNAFACEYVMIEYKKNGITKQQTQTFRNLLERPIVPTANTGRAAANFLQRILPRVNREWKINVQKGNSTGGVRTPWLPFGRCLIIRTLIHLRLWQKQFCSQF
jgi:hypothetical protein